MSELGIGKFVNATIGANRKVSPYVGSTLELDAFDASRGGFESLIGILGSNTCGNDMAIDVAVSLFKEINGIGPIGIGLAVEPANLGHVVEWNSHGHLKLRGRQVRARDSFRDGMLHLKTGIQLEEVVLVRIGIVQVLNGSGTLISNVLGQSLRRQFHLVECLFGNNGGWTLLEDLLEPTLRGTVTSVEGDGIAVLIAHDLDLDVTSVLAELHDEDGGANDLVGNLDVGVT
mmetsp:Transcript_14024/g.25566  ORF Transcript_14024/g.25566 Transcript_14024/m.25566 type:complete len:231 (+) Transcript_14024:486-1178(+)